MSINATFHNMFSSLSDSFLLQHADSKEPTFSLPPQPKPEYSNDERSIFKELFPNVSFFASVSYNRGHSIGLPSISCPDILNDISNHDMEILYNFMQAKIEGGFQSFFSIWFAFNL